MEELRRKGLKDHRRKGQSTGIDIYGSIYYRQIPTHKYFILCGYN